LPKAFAIIRDTARRFKENDYIEVTATDFDRLTAAKYDNVKIVGDKAHWHKQWMRQANDHLGYGSLRSADHRGHCLHEGKVAEMATEKEKHGGNFPAFLNALAKRGVHIVT